MIALLIMLRYLINLIIYLITNSGTKIAFSCLLLSAPYPLLILYEVRTSCGVRARSDSIPTASEFRESVCK